MRRGPLKPLLAWLRGRLSSPSGRKRSDQDVSQGSSSYNDIKNIENVVGTFKQLVSKLSREASEIGELYVTAENRAVHYELLSEAVIESVTSGILVVDKRGEVALVNSSARRLLGVEELNAPSPVRLQSLLSDGAQLERLIERTFETGRSSRRNALTVRTLDGVSRRIGASISCFRPDPAVDAVIVVFTGLGGDKESGRKTVADEKARAERESYLRGVLDSYDLMSGILAGAERTQSSAEPDRTAGDRLDQFVRDVRQRCDLMMVFALAKGGSSSMTELVDLNGLVQSIIGRKGLSGNPGLVEDLSPGLPSVKTVGKVLEMGLEILIEGCMEASPEGVEVRTALWRDGGVDVAGVTVDERGPTKPVADIGDSLRDLAADSRLRREAGLLLLRSLPSESHRIAVKNRGNSFSFSAGIVLPIQGKAGPSMRSGDISDRGKDESQLL